MVLLGHFYTCTLFCFALAHPFVPLPSPIRALRPLCLVPESPFFCFHVMAIPLSHTRQRSLLPFHYFNMPPPLKKSLLTNLGVKSAFSDNRLITPASSSLLFA